MRFSWITLRAYTWIVLVTFFAFLFGGGPAAKAVTLYWDSDGNATGNNTTTGAGLGGSGNWGGNLWYNGTANVAWADGSDAVFWGPTAGTVSPAATRSVNSLAFKTGGYVIQGSTINLGGPTVTVDTGAASLVTTVTGSAGLVKEGAGALHLANFNSYSGGTIVNGGVLGMANGSLGALPVSPAINLTLNNGSTLRYNADGLNLNINRQIVLGTNGGSFNTNGFSGGLAGVISGTSLTKIGAGTLALTNNNTYSGGTTVSTGTLLANNVNGSATGTGAVTVNLGATLGGSGAVGGDVTNNGIVAPGNTVNLLSMGGAYTQGAGGKLEIELASPSTFDRLGITGAATLSGMLAVTLTSGFVPQAGNSFTILTASGLGGTQFTTTSLPTLPTHLGWAVDYSATSVTLSVNQLGDFNKNGTVDGADYVLWRSGLGTTFEADDYDLWRAHFGHPGAGSGAASAAAVPEAATCSLIALSACAALAIRRRKSS